MMLESDLALSPSNPSSMVAFGRPAAPPNSELWPIIWSAGGLCWLAIAILGLLWAWPTSGTTQNGDYIVSSTARIVHYGLLFLMSACAYRLGLGQGWPRERIRRARVLVLHLALALLVARLSPLLLVLVDAVVDVRWSYLRGDIDGWLPFQPTWMQWVGLLRFWMVPYVLGLIAVALVYTARQYHRESMRLVRLSAEVANLRMSMLSAQLHPHFLFNALHAISQLINESPAQATTMVARLGDFLRIALESAKRAWIRVEEEVLGLDAYLAVQQTRFGDRLSVTFSVDPAAMSTFIPALLLQPIVENAIEHGLSDPGESLAVTMRISRTQDRLIVIVTNSAPQLTETLMPAAFGNGLRNVNARLFAAYGDDGGFSVGPDPVRGTRAELNLPVAVNNTRSEAGDTN
jgi:two-component system LytT family sensor kinase